MIIIILEIFAILLALFCGLIAPAFAAVFLPINFPKEKVIEILERIPLDYDEKLANIIKVSDKLINASFYLLITADIVNIFHIILPFTLCRFGEENFIIPNVIILTIQISSAFIAWCMSLAIENNIYKMAENFFLHEIIDEDFMLLSISFSTCFFIFLVVVFIVLLCYYKKEFCENNKYKIIYPLFIIFESFLFIFTVCILPKNSHYENDYFQKVYTEFCQKYKFCPIITNINELENLKALNKAFLAFVIIIFFITFIKFFLTVCAENKDEDFRAGLLIPSVIQLIFIVINFCLIITIVSKVNKKGRTDAFYVATYYLKRKIKIVLGNTIFFIILFILELIPSCFDKCEKKENQESYRVSPFRSNTPPFPTFPTFSSSNERVSQNIGEAIPKGMEEIIMNLEEKIKDFLKTFIDEEKKVKDKFDKFLKERHLILDKFIKDSEKEKNDKTKNKEEFEKIIKDLNKEEYDYEIDILINKVNKIHYIFKLGIDAVNKCKDIIVKNLEGKMASLPAIAKSKIESQIKEITDYKAIEFLDSTFGKLLKAALEKYGLSRIFINSLKKELMDERNKRRENERKEFSLEKNTFGDEKNIFEVDLYKFITEEFNDEDFNEKLRKEMISQIIITNN